MIDPIEHSRDIAKSVADAFMQVFPIEGSKHILRLNGVDVEPNEYMSDYPAQLKAKLSHRSLFQRVVGDFSLIDKATGKVLDRKKMTLAHLPALTDRYSYIVGGTEYTVPIQLRLKPGVYTERKEDGTIQAKLNLVNLRGKSAAVVFDPTTRIFSFNYGSSELPLFPILEHLGVSGQELKSLVGEDIYKANIKDREKTVARFARALGVNPEDISKVFNETVLDPNVSKLTLGRSFSKVDGNVLLLATKKVIGVSKGMAKEDDKNSLAFKTPIDTADFLKERILKSKQVLHNRTLARLDRLNDISKIVISEHFSHPILTFFTSSQVVGLPSQVNPVDIASSGSKVTVLGEGGISSLDQIVEKQQQLDPSTFGFLDPIMTPDNSKAGLVVHMAAGAKKKGDSLVSKVWDVKNKQYTYITPEKAFESFVVLPDQVKIVDGKINFVSPRVKAIHKHEIVDIPASKVDYMFDVPEALFDIASLGIPFLAHDSGNRALLATKHIEQSLPLVDADHPLVDVEVAKGHGWSDVGRAAFPMVESPIDGVVSKVTKDHIVIKSGKNVAKVPLLNYFPLEDGGYAHSTPIVKPGDKVKKGDIVSETNFTDKQGKLKIGKNLLVAYVPYKGLNFEDGIVVSESAAKKLTSRHLYRENVYTSKGIAVSKNKLLALYPGIFNTNQLNKLDSDGVIKEGEYVDEGDPLIAVLQHDIQPKPEELLLARFSKKLYQPWKNKTVTWTNPFRGRVVRVVKGKNIDVYIETEEPAQVGDKLSTRAAPKGIITYIVPDAEMPKTESGKTIDVIVNPLGIPSRLNFGQVLEAAAGKIAEKTGKPKMVAQFKKGDLEEIEKELKEHRISDKEYLIDPTTGVKTEHPVLVGPEYILKLKHTALTKATARGGGVGEKYSYDSIPLGGEGAQSLGHLGLYAMLAHGALKNLYEMQTYKSSANPEFWFALQSGAPLPPPSVPVPYKKFVDYLRTLGVDVKKTGNVLQLYPLYDEDILKLSSGEIDPTKIIRGKDLREEPGGLFDPVKTGGITGTKYSHITLNASFPNPIYKDAFAILFGMTRTQYDELIQGKLGVTDDGKLSPDGKYRLDKAFKKLLSTLDVKKELAESEERIKNTSGNERAKLARKIRILRHLAELKRNPEDVYMTKHVLVIPPYFRPITETKDRSISVNDLNGLYRNIGILNQQLKQAKELTDKEQADAYSSVYSALEALQMNGLSVGSKQYRSVLDIIAGPQPKLGYFQQSLLKRRQDLSARAVIVVPKESMPLDEVGLPEKMAWTIFGPLVIRRLTRAGYTTLQATEMVKNKVPAARTALEREMKERPVLLKRDPVLHRYNVMAFYPKLVSGEAIHIHPLTLQGFGGDLDGDAFSVFTPVTENAVKELQNLLPSNNLFSTTSGKALYAPRHEGLMGLYLLSRVEKKSDKKFDSVKDLMTAVNEKKVSLNEEVTVAGKRTTAGRILIQQALPKGYEVDVLTGKNLAKLLSDIGHKHPNDYPSVVEKLRVLGNDYAFRYGVSMGIEDVKVPKSLQEYTKRVWDKAERMAANTKDQDKKTKILLSAKAAIEKKALETLPKDSFLYKMVESGARGNPGQLLQMTVGPGLVEQHGKLITVPIKSGYGAGMDVTDYFTSMLGARSGLVSGKAREIRDPGWLSKQMLASVLDVRVTSDDCGVKKGTYMSVDDDQILGRYLPNDVTINGKVYRRNTIITPELLSEAKKAKIKELEVRSPLNCQAPHGVCKKCMGLNPSGKEHRLGEFVGVSAAHAIGEPSSQLALSGWHTGGAVGAQISPFNRLRQLLAFPENLSGESVLAQTFGKVEAIHKKPLGTEIVINKVTHWVPSDRKVTVSVGDKVTKGQPISTGLFNPRKHMELVGVEGTRNKLVDEIYNLLRTQTPIRRTNVELIVKALTNVAEVDDRGGHPHWLEGDLVPLNHANWFNKSGRFAEVSKGNAVGGKLLENYKGFKKGTIVDRKMLPHLPDQVKVELPPVKYKPVLKGINVLPLEVGSDWMTKLNFERIKTSVIEAAITGGKTKLQSFNPIPDLVYGTDFADVSQIMDKKTK